MTLEYEDPSIIGHNPYFSRWFSAMCFYFSLMASYTSHNPYFSRWFSAIHGLRRMNIMKISHNPYFSRWFSAIIAEAAATAAEDKVTILILVDGFLQYRHIETVIKCTWVTILILVDGFLQSNIVLITISVIVSHNPYFSRWFSAITYLPCLNESLY